MAQDPKNTEQMAPVKDVSKDAAAVGAAQAAPDKIDTIVQDWVVHNIYDSPIARDTEAYNYLNDRLKVLATTLRGLIK